MLLTAFILGLAGSLHCAGMCGPLALMLPVVGKGSAAFAVSRCVYNLGRVATYCVLGAMAGVFGEALAFAGFQRWLSLLAGFFLLAGLLFTRFSGTQFGVGLVAWIKSAFGSLLRKRSYSGLLALGAANGLLPCGLVYVAATAAATTAQVREAAEYMFAFGIGTLPMMLAIPLAGRSLNSRFNFQRVVPLSIALVAVILIFRGLSLGIPYLSPNLAGGNAGAACH
jgi:sulfite exporter TauE/SafE